MFDFGTFPTNKIIKQTQFPHLIGASNTHYPNATMQLVQHFSYAEIHTLLWKNTLREK